MKFLLTLLTFLVCVYAGSVAGQINPKPQAQATEENDQDQPMEEVIVIGQRTLGSLRVQISKAEDRMFDIYNKLNTDDLYDVHCRMERRRGIASRIRFKYCTTVYFDKTEADTTQLAMNGVPVGASYMNAKLAHYNPIMREKWMQLAKDNPELLQAIMQHYELTQELKKARQAYFGGDD